MECVDGCGQPDNCDCEECLCGGSPQTEEPSIEGRTHLQTIDTLNDLIAGFEHWKDTKLTSGTWNHYDEHFARWVEAGPLSED